MRRMRAMGIGVVAAALVVMAVGAGSASATTTQLCKVSTSPCPAGDVYPAESKFVVKGEFALTGVTSCAMTYEFHAGASGGATVAITETSFSFSLCSNGAPKPLHLPWSWPVSVTSPPNGFGELQTGGSGSPGFEAGGCAYEKAMIPQKIAGGSPTFLSTPGTSLTSTGCSSSTTLGMGGDATPTVYVTN